MDPVVYADFTSPLCYVAGLWVDRQAAAGTVIDWRAVEHAPHLSLLGVTVSADTAMSALWPLSLELAEAAKLPLPDGGDELPTALPPVVSNTRAAVAAYAEAVTDGVQHEIRRRLFHAIWIEGRHLSSAYDVRRIITDVTYPRVPIGPYLSTSLPRPMTGDPDPWTATRRQGGVIAPDGGPLTTLGYRRIRAWREQWLALNRPRLPILVDGHGAVYDGADAVRRLAGQTPPPAPALAFPTEPVGGRVAVPGFH